LSLGDLLVVLGVSLITSKGAHGMPGSPVVILAAIFERIAKNSRNRPRAGAVGRLVHQDGARSAT
jgi:hypothetical protein